MTTAVPTWTTTAMGSLMSRTVAPMSPETFNGFQDKDGCPDQIPAPPPPPPPPPDPSPPPPPPPPAGVLIQENSIVILEKIQFATGSAVILATSSKILDAVATTLKTHPEFLLVEVEGHADARDSDAYNLRLTQARATSVVTALVKAGVDKSRLRAKGYGKYCPEDPANTPAAWDKNRRVEFKIVKTGSGPTGVELGCAAAGAKGVRSDPIP